MVKTGWEQDWTVMKVHHQSAGVSTLSLSVHWLSVSLDWLSMSDNHRHHATSVHVPQCQTTPSTPLHQCTHLNVRQPQAPRYISTRASMSDNPKHPATSVHTPQCQTTPSTPLHQYMYQKRRFLEGLWKYRCMTQSSPHLTEVPKVKEKREPQQQEVRKQRCASGHTHQALVAQHVMQAPHVQLQCVGVQPMLQ